MNMRSVQIDLLFLNRLLNHNQYISSADILSPSISLATSLEHKEPGSLQSRFVCLFFPESLLSFPLVPYPRNKRIECEDAKKTENVVFRNEMLSCCFFSYAFQ